ncbi:SAM-dependent methyltransferase [Thermomonas sp.]|jgi:SAM-dependent MidA family methyltransferase|uniref:class I SAM-dependent methyltransferase n=1 Tax=Thermomonas sp. TaxID=1971895 RepID=UPI00259A2105|nr:SAM-dependent methyltransferase [Thermomonas sp.]MBS0460771.1 SAM-dependent methyltransferase [Pseudomonadota bacterium]HOC11260.1 SAM-dependent methyltransferase [Thermomonas sp.]HOV97080.1 SAM-dependent methyltransferase [Thermomonas sp.]HQA02228.1 SAM-dependent methyltransferase [Thermomonas sp.]HQE07909.1 SAM-dependent methyltransferase [Thermomonas sp.]
MSPLGAPSADAQAHSAHLREVIQEQIIAAGGSIPFWKYMELALYTPGLGYYSAGAHKFGKGGDFITAPERSPLFSAGVATAIAPALRQAGKGAVFMELGGGSGAFAESCLLALQDIGVLPARYAMLEPSADLRQRQRERLQAQLPAELFARVEWLDGPIAEIWNGVLFANEVIDALPVPRFVIRAGEVMEEHVALDGEGRFVRTEKPADAMLIGAVRNIERRLPEPLPEGYRSEALAQLPYWMQAVVGGLQNGALLLIDYGYARSEFYQPERSDGTLRAFRQQHVTNDVFAWPGLQDITASVDFTAVAEACVGAGFEFSGYCSQSSFLLGNGLERHLQAAEAQAADEVARHNLRQQVKHLTLPSEMGERFQAIGFQRGVELDAAFLLGDLSHHL